LLDVDHWSYAAGPRSEGKQTTGVPPFGDVEFSENRFRRELGLPLRDLYDERPWPWEMADSQRSPGLQLPL